MKEKEKKVVEAYLQTMLSAEQQFQDSGIRSYFVYNLLFIILDKPTAHIEELLRVLDRNENGELMGAILCLSQCRWGERGTKFLRANRSEDEEAGLFAEQISSKALKRETKRMIRKWRTQLRKGQSPLFEDARINDELALRRQEALALVYVEALSYEFLQRMEISHVHHDNTTGRVIGALSVVNTAVYAFLAVLNILGEMYHEEFNGAVRADAGWAYGLGAITAGFAFVNIERLVTRLARDRVDFYRNRGFLAIFGSVDDPLTNQNWPRLTRLVLGGNVVAQSLTALRNTRATILIIGSVQAWATQYSYVSNAMAYYLALGSHVALDLPSFLSPLLGNPMLFEPVRRQFVGSFYRMSDGPRGKARRLTMYQYLDLFAEQYLPYMTPEELHTFSRGFLLTEDTQSYSDELRRRFGVILDAVQERHQTPEAVQLEISRWKRHFTRWANGILIGGGSMVIGAWANVATWEFLAHQGFEMFKEGFSPGFTGTMRPVVGTAFMMAAPPTMLISTSLVVVQSLEMSAFFARLRYKMILDHYVQLWNRDKLACLGELVLSLVQTIRIGAEGLAVSLPFFMQAVLFVTPIGPFTKGEPFVALFANLIAAVFSLATGEQAPTITTESVVKDEKEYDHLNDEEKRTLCDYEYNAVHKVIRQMRDELALMRGEDIMRLFPQRSSVGSAPEGWSGFNAEQQRVGLQGQEMGLMSLSGSGVR